MKRVLCLHGYRQSAESFRRSTAVLRKALGKHQIELDALHKVPSSTSTQCSDDNEEQQKQQQSSCQFSWWQTIEQPAAPVEYEGCQESIDYLRAVFKQQGPFCGVLGFSQGAVMASLLCRQRQTDFCFNFAVLIGGFLCRDQRFWPPFESADERWRSTMHVIGLKDEWVPPERSQVLANAFLTPFATATTVVHEHPGGHLVPQDSTNRRSIVDFIVGNCIK